jgi:hypothetical protein
MHASWFNSFQDHAGSIRREKLSVLTGSDRPGARAELIRLSARRRVRRSQSFWPQHSSVNKGYIRRETRNCGAQCFEIDYFRFRISNGFFSKLGWCGIALDIRELLVDRYGKPGGSIYETVQYWTGESRCGQAKEDTRPKHT